jgi:AraC-like DNA-binding protein
MESCSGSPFEWRPIVRSRDVDQTRAYLGARFGEDLRFDPAWDRSKQFNVQIEGVDLPNTLIHYVQCSGATIEGSRPENHYVVNLPVSGCMEATVRGKSIVCDPYHGAIFCRPIAPETTLRHRKPAAGLYLRLSQTAIMRQLGALLGEPATTLPEFAPTIDLGGGYGRSLAHQVLLAVKAFKQKGATLSDGISVSEFEDWIVEKLLISQPHDYSAAIQRTERRILPGDVRRAIDFMRANLGAPIGIAEIVQASGISGRTLFAHFRDYHGISPIRYLRNARFDKVRDALMRARPEQSITEIAMACGFSHMGRFSVEYRRRFGESPSESRRGHRKLSPR